MPEDIEKEIKAPNIKTPIPVQDISIVDVIAEVRASGVESKKEIQNQGYLSRNKGSNSIKSQKKILIEGFSGMGKVFAAIKGSLGNQVNSLKAANIMTTEKRKDDVRESRLNTNKETGSEMLITKLTGWFQNTFFDEMRDGFKIKKVFGGGGLGTITEILKYSGVGVLGAKFLEGFVKKYFEDSIENFYEKFPMVSGLVDKFGFALTAATVSLWAFAIGPRSTLRGVFKLMTKSVMGIAKLLGKGGLGKTILSTIKNFGGLGKLLGKGKGGLTRLLGKTGLQSAIMTVNGSVSGLGKILGKGRGGLTRLLGKGRGGLGFAIKASVASITATAVAAKAFLGIEPKVKKDIPESKKPKIKNDTNIQKASNLTNDVNPKAATGIAKETAGVVLKTFPWVGEAAGLAFMANAMFAGDKIGAGLEGISMLLPSFLGLPLDIAIASRSMAEEKYKHTYGKYRRDDDSPDSIKREQWKMALVNSHNELVDHLKKSTKGKIVLEKKVYTPNRNTIDNHFMKNHTLDMTGQNTIYRIMGKGHNNTIMAIENPKDENLLKRLRNLSSNSPMNSGTQYYDSRNQSTTINSPSSVTNGSDGAGAAIIPNAGNLWGNSPAYN